MRLVAYVLLLFSMTLTAYLMGETSIIMNIHEQHGGYMDASTILSTIASAVISEAGMSALLGGLLLGVGAVLLGGFGAMYIVPIVIVTVVLNLFVFPFSTIMNPAAPEMLRIPVVVFFNLLTLLAMVTFIRGGG